MQIYQNSKNISVFYHSVTYFYNFHIPAGFFSLIFRPFGYRLAQLHHLQTLHLPGFDKGILNLIFEFFFLNLNEKSKNRYHGASTMLIKSVIFEMYFFSQ